MSFKGQTASQNTKCFSEKDLQTIKSLESEQTKFKKLVASSKDYSEIEKALINFNTLAEVDAFWQKTNNAKEEYEQRQERGCGLCLKSYQTSAVMVQSFMKDFSPIIDIVKDFGAPYGGLAIGTISVFFVIAGNKDNMEECLASAISAIEDGLPGLNLYKHIYNDNHELDMRLQARIVSAYQAFIEFCIEASRYYKGGGPRRWLKALGRPNSILDRANRVQCVIVDIRRLCDELLDKKVHLIKQLNLDQKVTIEKLLEAQDDNMLSEIQRLLGLSAFSDENQRKELDQYREALASDEQLNAAYFEQMRGHRFDSFKACEDYQSWMKSEHACLLILSGYNNKSIAQLDECWLSPVAMAMIPHPPTGPSQPTYAYYIFTPSGELLYRALSVILLQLLRQKRRVLRDRARWDEFRAELYTLQRHESQDKEVMGAEDERLSAFYQVVLRVMSFFDESETVHVILDRADRCCDLKNRVDHRKPLLKMLVRMVEAARCKLRVLVVINGYQWNVEQRRDELDEKTQGKMIVHTAEQEVSV